jgi:hypothetical protein
MGRSGGVHSLHSGRVHPAPLWEEYNPPGWGGIHLSPNPLRATHIPYPMDPSLDLTPLSRPCAAHVIFFSHYMFPLFCYGSEPRYGGPSLWRTLAMADLRFGGPPSLWRPFAMADLRYGGPSLWRPFAMADPNRYFTQFYPVSTWFLT